MLSDLLRRRWTRLSWFVVAIVAVVACSETTLPSSELGDSTDTSGSSMVPHATLTIDTAAVGGPFDRRLLGTNVPAWIGPERLADSEFVAATVQSGVSLLRMPGGSWSNAYDWAACELRDAEGCVFADSARPTDFIDFMQATGVEGSWTVSVNSTAQHAAAAVAYFNGDIDDPAPIGVDRDGRDWATVGFWAGVRANGGNPDPVGIQIWEVGNEVYGGRPESGGDQCAAFGWEDVWTCDGTEYVVGDETHDGYLAIRQAMRAVDPDVQVGAVGVSDPASWNDWGNEVIDAAGEELDFYVVHQYGFDASPAGALALGRPAELWPTVFEDVRNALGTDVPIAVTEHNLVSFEAGDTERSMTQAVNAFYLADTIGQLAQTGASIANQWNLANGTTGSGTDYGLIRLDDASTFPAFEAMKLWSAMGSELLDVETPGDMDNLRAYATRHDDGRLTLMILNLGEQRTDATIALVGAPGVSIADVSGVSTDDLAASELTTLADSQVDVVDGSFEVTLPGWSIVKVEVATDG